MIMGTVHDDILTQLGSMSCAELRKDDVGVALAAVICEISPEDLRAVIDRTHGRTLVRNALSARWPSTEEAVDVHCARTVASFRPRRWEFSSGGQGRKEHRCLQRSLSELGAIRGHVSFVDRGYEIDCGVIRKPDVTWHRRGSESVFYAFEIEFGPKSAMAKSWETLEKLHAALNCSVVFIAPRANISLARDIRPISLRHETHAVQLLSAESLLAAMEDGGHYSVHQRLR
jgi:hypothetical protein